MKDLLKILLFCLSVVALLTLLFWKLSQPNENKEVTTKLDKNIPASVLAHREIQRVYTTPDDNDSTDAIVVLKDTVSYWYVYYKCGMGTEGYRVIKLNTSYYTILSAIKQIRPDAGPRDFVGVMFFKRVTYEAYKSYMETDGD